MIDKEIKNEVGKNILITGGTGFVGSNVVNKLKENEKNKLVILSRSQSYVDNNIECIKCDLLDEYSLNKIQRKLQTIDHVLHLAAMGPNSSTQDELKYHFEQNLQTSLNLIKYLPATLKGFIYASTIDVYGEPIYNPIDEKHPTAPTTYYAASKLATEKYLDIFFTRQQIPLTILRYSSIYGPGEPVIKAIPNFIEKVLAGYAPVLFGDGSDVRDYVYVDDVVNAAILALYRNSGGVFNIGSGKGYSIREVLDMIIELSGKKIDPIYEPRIKRAFSSVLDITLAKKMLGYSPSTDLKNGLRNQVSFEKRRREEAVIHYKTENRKHKGIG